MAKTETTKIIEACLFDHFFLKKSMRCGLEVETLSKTSDYWSARVDFLAYNKKDEFTFIEIKISLSDFKSSHGHNFNGHRNYYAMTKELYEKVKDIIPTEIGVYILEEYNSRDFKKKINVKAYQVTLVKKCKVIKYCRISKSAKLIAQQKYNVITACNSTIRRLTSSLREIEVIETKED